MELVSLIALIVAIVLFVLAGFTYPRGNPPTIHLGWFGMAALGLFLGIQLM
jgi:hypothetical protein